MSEVAYKPNVVIHETDGVLGVFIADEIYVNLRKEKEILDARLATLSRLWRDRPAGLAEYASHYGNGAWVRELERALGVEGMM